MSEPPPPPVFPAAAGIQTPTWVGSVLGDQNRPGFPGSWVPVATATTEGQGQPINHQNHQNQTNHSSRQPAAPIPHSPLPIPPSFRRKPETTHPQLTTCPSRLRSPPPTMFVVQNRSCHNPQSPKPLNGAKNGTLWLTMAQELKTPASIPPDLRQRLMECSSWTWKYKDMEIQPCVGRRAGLPPSTWSVPNSPQSLNNPPTPQPSEPAR